ncbi:MAG TPA: hypothetical protein VFE05_01890 [Longimicrobiaceae bacterium]|jgi:hypothetical protein|nr:hypothetical protein [Longimicrobiaceae bacterium]
MLEEIHSTPEDRRTVKLILDVALVLFGLSTLADSIFLGTGTMFTVVGLAFSAAGVASFEWLRRQPVPRPLPVRARA